ncbi:MAG: hypothetical protein V1860_02120 [bacterium]
MKKNYSCEDAKADIDFCLRNTGEEALNALIRVMGHITAKKGDDLLCRECYNYIMQMKKEHGVK